MTGGEIAAIITAIVGALIGISGIFISAATSRRAAKKDEVDSLCEIVDKLQAENARLIARIDMLESDLEQREQRIAVLEKSLRETTELRQEREQRIRELETEIATLQTKVSALEAKRRR
jgi:predicted nuclease with TOPRIM domain